MYIDIDKCADYGSSPYSHLLKDVKKEGCRLIGHSNAGSCGMDSSGKLGALEQVWLNEGGVATIIPLKQLEKLWHVTYNSRHHGGAFDICTDVGEIVLKNNSKSMPYLDLRELKAKADMSFMQTMPGNMEGFTKREVEEMQKAQEAQVMLGHTTNRGFLGMVRGGMISNCPMTVSAVMNAHQIFGPDLTGVRGRIVRTTDYVQFPWAILE